MEVAVGSIRDCPANTVMSIRGAGIRRQAPVRQYQKFYFPNANPGEEFRVEFLRMVGSVTVTLDSEGNATTTKDLQLSSSDGPISVDLHATRVLAEEGKKSARRHATWPRSARRSTWTRTTCRARSRTWCA